MIYLSLKKENNTLRLASYQLKVHYIGQKAKLVAVEETPAYYGFRQTIIKLSPWFSFKWSRTTKKVLWHRLDLFHS